MTAAHDGASPGTVQGKLDSVSWGGSVVWQNARAGEEVSSLTPVLAGLGAPEAQARFVQETLHPLLLSMVSEAVRSLPGEPAFFCVEWLLKYLSAPSTVCDAVQGWWQEEKSPRRSTEEKRGAQRASTSKSDDSGRASKRSTTAEAAPRGSALKKGSRGMKRLDSRNATIKEGEADEMRHELQALIAAHGDGAAKASCSAGDGADSLSAAATCTSPSERRSGRKRRSSVRVVMPPLREIERMLGRIKAMESLDQEDITNIAKLCTCRQYDAQAEIVNYGDIGTDLLVVMSGSCRVLVPEYKRTLKAGDCFNEAVLTKGEVSSEAMLCAAPNTDVQLLSVNVKDMETLGCWKKTLKKQKRVADQVIGKGATPKPRGGGPASRNANYFSEAEEEEELCETKPSMHIEKSEQDMEHIRLAVSRNQLTDLLQLSEEQIHELASCMHLQTYPAGAMVVKKGDPGEHFYVVHEGVAELINNPDPDDPFKNVPGSAPAIQFWAGSSFGEIALLYNCQRKATIVTVKPTSLWVLDLTGWRYVLEKMPSSRIETYVGLLNQVGALTEAIPAVDKREALADCLEEVHYQNGEQVATEGIVGLTLYIIFDGTCVARGGDSGPSRILRKGDYFGQDSLFNGEPYSETVVVTSDHATILQLDRETCQHMKLNIHFHGSASGPQSMKPRRHSLLHMATNGASDLQLHRLDGARLELPFSRLEAVGILGCGAFAEVSLVHDPVCDRLYALKAMSKAAIIDKNMQSVVVAERNTLAEMGDCPFVVRLITTYKDATSIYLLMEPAIGGELFALYADFDWYGNEEKAIFFATCVGLGLDYIHSKKIIHRDIKLENVLVDAKGYGVVTDLGIAKVVIGKTYTVCGTSDYFAPETLKQAGHNRAVDWWALGILTFAMMAARTPFDADDVLQIYKNIVKGFRKEHFPTSFSEHLIDFVKSLCRKKPQERLAMLPGGVRNIAMHPWLSPNGDTEKWSQIQSRRYQVTWEPPPMTVEQRRAVLRQSTGDDTFVEVADITDWDECF